MLGVPPLDELARFNSASSMPDPDGLDSGAGGAAGDLSALMAALPQDKAGPKAQFAKGDKVRVCACCVCGVCACGVCGVCVCCRCGVSCVCMCTCCRCGVCTRTCMPVIFCWGGGGCMYACESSRGGSRGMFEAPLSWAGRGAAGRQGLTSGEAQAGEQAGRQAGRGPGPPQPQVPLAGQLSRVQVGEHNQGRQMPSPGSTLPPLNPVACHQTLLLTDYCPPPPLPATAARC